MLTKENVYRNFAHVIVHIEFAADFLLHALHNSPTITIECTQEALQHKLMERRNDQFPMRSPLLALANEQAIAQPRLKVTILGRFGQMHLTAKNNFNISRFAQEHEHFVAEKSPTHMTIVAVQLLAQLSDLCEWKSKSDYNDID